MLFENLIKAEAMVDYSTLIGRVLKAHPTNSASVENSECVRQQPCKLTANTTYFMWLVEVRMNKGVCRKRQFLQSLEPAYKVRELQNTFPRWSGGDVEFFYWG